MGLWDTLSDGFGKLNEMATKKNAEIAEARERLERYSDDELFRIAKRNNFSGEKIAACQILKERGYGRQ